MSASLRLDRLRQFIGDLAAVIDTAPDEAALLAEARPLLAELVRHDDWLPEDYARPDPQRYQQYLLHADSRQRFRWSASSGARVSARQCTTTASGV